VKARNPHLSVCQLGATIGRMWRELTEEEKRKHLEDFHQDKVMFSLCDLTLVCWSISWRCFMVIEDRHCLVVIQTNCQRGVAPTTAIRYGRQAQHDAVIGWLINHGLLLCCDWCSQSVVSVKAVRNQIVPPCVETDNQASAPFWPLSKHSASPC